MVGKKAYTKLDIIKKGLNKEEMKMLKSTRKRIEEGYYRKKYGLDTSSGSIYSFLRRKGFSDTDAQYTIFRSKGKIR